MRRLIRRIFSVTVLASVVTVVPAVSSVPAHKVEYRSAPVVDVQQVPGRDLAERFVTVDLDGRHHRIRTSEDQLAATPGNQVCISKRTLLRDHWVIYTLKAPGLCTPV
ncbi:hypothetical protein [uncultured Roseobacter sp.]|uniref:hypothetical protein n=1 Tax=uncultured Roseobacter sp. TaxID=114847 RepID=UPI002619A807|nr:hypothetical protein [uncultured Roseobacter sp.]